MGNYKMANEMLQAIAVISDRHGLDPTRRGDLEPLMMALGAVLMSIVRTGEPRVHGITIRDETRKGVRGTAITVLYDDTEEPAA